MANDYKAIILYLSENLIKACRIKNCTTSFAIGQDTYYHEDIYFGDWIPLRNAAHKIVGFKLVPFVKDEFLRQRILPADFITLAENVSVEKTGDNTYISVVVEPSPVVKEDTDQFIEAAVFHNQRDNFIIRLDGFREADWQQLEVAAHDMDELLRAES